jgi:small-conductance mechanosensitive channel
MTTDMIGRLIQLIVAPVVMISSAAVLLNGLFTHFGEVNGRIRELDTERFTLVHTISQSTRDDRLIDERLEQIDHQLPRLLHRHGLIQAAILTIYYAILALVVTMFVVAAAALTELAWLATATLVLLLLGTAILLYGLVLTTSEIRVARESVLYETQRVMALGRERAADAGDAAAGASPSSPRA